MEALIITVLFALVFLRVEADPTYSPGRAPALPLAVRSPYTSAWSTTASNGTLNSNSVMFWPGNDVGWEGIVSVDGIFYEYLGIGSKNLPNLTDLTSATPLTVSYDSQYSNFTFAAGPVTVEASFFSSVIPKDLCRTSIPLSYFTASVVSTDSAPHDIQFYSDVNAAWITYESDVVVEWDLYEGSTLVNGTNSTGQSSPIFSWLVHLQQAYEFSENNQFPGWGNFTYSSTKGQAKAFTYESGFSTDLRYRFVTYENLQNTIDQRARGSGDQEPVFAFSHDFGSVTSASVLYTIGSVQQPIIRYLTCGGVLPLQPWWESCYGDIYQMINYHYNDFASSAALGAAFESQLKTDIDKYYRTEDVKVFSNNSNPGRDPVYYPNGTKGFIQSTDQFGQEYIFNPNDGFGFLDPNNFSGIATPDVMEAESYYSIVALSTRQVMGAYVLAVPPDLSCLNNSDPSVPLMFQKEISSDGNVNTVDVMYPAMPFFLYANPELLKYNMNPLYQNQESGFYPNGYSMHDLGSNFPNATGHVEGDDEYMPVEESGNMILMTYAYYKFSGDSSYLSQHYAKMNQWAQYLLEYSLIPSNQLSTDDFAGTLANQTNLALKGIVAIKAMAEIASIVGASSDAANFSTTAANYTSQWEGFAIDPSGNHTLLAYQSRSSWGLLYNLYPDKLLNLGTIPQYIYDMESNWYPTVSQIFGVPLDSRHSYTKSDWEMWTAAVCSQSTRRLIIDALAYWLNETTTNLAFTDLYDTITGVYPVSDGSTIEFIARPVQGGQFALLALGAEGETATTGTGSNSTVQVRRADALQRRTAAASRRGKPLRMPPIAEAKIADINS
ncbi:MAG: hypothetical protein M1834_003221 [Cirrosporium novae-zelandiae]|nr:MAG: hypothetical protein M1834_003221 [Cirrosporium novae-zelandiae]